MPAAAARPGRLPSRSVALDHRRRNARCHQ